MYRLLEKDKKQNIEQYFFNHKQEQYDYYRIKKDTNGANAILKLEEKLNLELDNMRKQGSYQSDITVEVKIRNKEYILTKYL